LAASSGIGLTSIAGCTGVIGGGGGDDTIVVGNPLPFGGGFSPASNSIRQGIKLGVRRINDNGGILGKEVELVEDDNDADPATTQEVIRKQIEQDGADFIIGTILSSSRVAMAEVLKSEQIPGSMVVHYEGRVAEDYCNEWQIKMGPTPYQLVRPIVPWLMENYGSKFYLYGMDYLWPRSTFETVNKWVEENGGEVVGEDYVALGTTDHTSNIQEIKETDADVLWSMVNGVAAIPFQKQAANFGILEQMKQLDLANIRLIMEGIPKEAIVGTLECNAYWEKIDTDRNREFVSALHDMFGEDTAIAPYTGLAYNATRFMKAGMEKAGTTDPVEVKNNLEGNTVDGPMGKVSMPYDTQAKVGTYVTEVDEDYYFRPVEQFDAVMPPEHCG